MSNTLDLLFTKKRNQGYKIAFVIFIAFVLVNICMEMILFNYNNLQTGLLDNDKLMLLQMYGKNEEKETCFMNEDIIKQVNHVLFVTESFPINICLYDKNEKSDINEDVCVHKIPKKYGKYVGIEKMEDGVIYCPKGSMDKEVLEKCEVDEQYKDLKLRLEEYNEEAPPILEGEQFVTEETFDKIMKIERKIVGEENANIIYSTPEYLIGVDKTENVFDVVDELKERFLDYHVEIFYQASGLKSFVSGSTNMIMLQVIVACLIVISSFIIIYALLTSMINKMEKNMMVLYINGMTRKEISMQLFYWLTKMLIVPFVCAIILSSSVYIGLSIFLFKTGFIPMYFIIIMLVNILDVCISIIFLRWALSSRINDRTSNDKISSMLRN